MIDPVHPEPEPKLRKARITVSSEFDLDPENYKNVEWPPGSGEEKSLTDPEEMLEFERHGLKTGEVDVLEMLAGHDAGSSEDTKLEMVPEGVDRGGEYIQDRGSGRDIGWRDETTGLISGPLPEPNND